MVTFDLTPDPKVLVALTHTPMSPLDALCELIDNPIGSVGECKRQICAKTGAIRYTCHSARSRSSLCNYFEGRSKSISDTAGWHDFHLDTSEGPVTVRVLVTPNGIWTANGCQPGCEDELHISDWPEGVTPVPLSVVVPEQSTGEINLYRFVGM